MRKALVVAKREYLAAVKTKAFLLSLVMMPIMMGASIGVQMLLKDKVDVTDKRVVVADRSGQVFDAIAEAAERRNERDIFLFKKNEDGSNGEPLKQIKPRFLVESVPTEGRDPDELGVELSERVRKREILAYVLIGPNVVTPDGDPASGAIAYHSNSPTYDDFQEWVAKPVNERIRRLRLQARNLDPADVEGLMRPVPVGHLGLTSRDESGKITEAKRTNKVANLFLPFGLMMLMFMVVMVGATPLMQGVIEEKSARIAEVLLGSLPPFELMLGKLIGMVGVTLTIVAVYLAGGYYAIHRAGYGSFFPTHLMVWFLLYQALAVLMYGSIFSAIGAAVTDAKEAQSLMTPVMLVLVAPMFIWLNVITEPGSTFALLCSLFPPATPMLMIMRQAVPPGVPFWQPMVGVVLVLLSTIFCVYAGGRIFRVGILMQGRAAKFRELAGWILRG
jgi:ABC-2 type transport system permease protein